MLWLLQNVPFKSCKGHYWNDNFSSSQLMILVDYLGSIFPPIGHSPWNGLRLADYVMPFFLFIAGVSLALAYKVQQVQLWKIISLGLQMLSLPVFPQLFVYLFYPEMSNLQKVFCCLEWVMTIVTRSILLYIFNRSLSNYFLRHHHHFYFFSHLGKCVLRIDS